MPGAVYGDGGFTFWSSGTMLLSFIIFTGRRALGVLQHSIDYFTILHDTSGDLQPCFTSITKTNKCTTAVILHTMRVCRALKTLEILTRSPQRLFEVRLMKPIYVPPACIRQSESNLQASKPSSRSSPPSGPQIPASEVRMRVNQSSRNKISKPQG